MTIEDASNISVPKTASETPVPPKRPASVSDIGLELTNIRLRFLICIPGNEQQQIPPATVEHTGKLVADSLNPSGFIAEVTWNLAFPDKDNAPISITGKHYLTFSTSKPIDPSDAIYYSEINAVILAYPYLRQIIEELTTKCLGQYYGSDP